MCEHCGAPGAWVDDGTEVTSTDQASSVVGSEEQFSGSVSRGGAGATAGSAAGGEEQMLDEEVAEFDNGELEADEQEQEQEMVDDEEGEEAGEVEAEELAYSPVASRGGMTKRGGASSSTSTSYEAATTPSSLSSKSPAAAAKFAAATAPRYPFPPLHVPLLHFLFFGLVVLAFSWQSAFPLDSFGWYMQFVTMDTLLLQAVYYILAMGVDLYPNNRRLRRVCDALFSLCAAASLTVAVAFWLLYSKNPQLIIPRGLEMPLELLILEHAVPAVLLLLDLTFAPHGRNPLLSDMLSVMAYGITYAAWSYLCFTKNGHWAYPFQDKFTRGMHGAFFSVMAVAGIVSLFVIKLLHRLVGHEAVPTNKAN